MKFNSPVEFEIPDDWWLFAEMNAFNPLGSKHYYYGGHKHSAQAQVVDLFSVEPPSRNAGAMFKKRKPVPVLFALSSDEIGLPPVEVTRLSGSQKYRFRVSDGFHRYYASAAVGYLELPVVISVGDGGQ
jgi:hypothetical protein